MTAASPLPGACAIAFKEWAGVCDALAEGRQSLILRKGGVSEGPGGFLPEHPAFWLYPTHVHEAEQGLRTPARPRHAPDPASVAIDTLAVVEWVGRVERIEQLAELEPFHDWTESTILGRFHYRRPGLWALAVRAYRRPEPATVAVTPAHLGCKTWVPLEDPPSTAGLVAVLDDRASAERLGRLRSLLDPPLGSTVSRGG
ncbi:DUF1802 family protein [Tundrisphaera sp. TA3]|uniref:DUF1802 family protein n=1 Tax=Tundrisphaera sp. TA3 TaxID=3435775 RepID=UPI003EB7EC3E